MSNLVPRSCSSLSASVPDGFNRQEGKALARQQIAVHVLRLVLNSRHVLPASPSEIPIFA